VGAIRAADDARQQHAEDTDEQRRGVCQMVDDAYLDGGTIIDGEEIVEQVGQRIFDLVVRVAGGEQSKSEELGMGDNEFVPWQIGAVM
jgi:altronate hydrolase